MNLREELIEAINQTLHTLAAIQETEEYLDRPNLSDGKIDETERELLGLGRYLAIQLDILAPHLLLWQSELEETEGEDEFFN